MNDKQLEQLVKDLEDFREQMNSLENPDSSTESDDYPYSYYQGRKVRLCGEYPPKPEFPPNEKIFG